MGNIFDQFDEPAQSQGGNMFDQFDEQPTLQMQTPRYDMGGDRDSGGGLNDYLMGQARGGKPKQPKQFNLNAEWNSIRQDPLRGLGDVGLGIAKGVNNVASTIDLFNPLAYTDFGRSGRNMLNQQARTFEKAATNKIPFQAGKVVGEIVPTLGIPGGVAGGLAKKIATGALSGGLQAGLMDAGEQQADTGNIDWGRAAAQGAVGTMFGGMGGAVTHGIQKLIGKWKGQGLPQAADDIAEGIDNAASQPLQTLDDLVNQGAIAPDALSEGELMALKAMQSESVPAETKTLEDMMSELSPEAARAAKPRYRLPLVEKQDNVLRGEQRFIPEVDKTGQMIHGQNRGALGQDLATLPPGYLTPEEINLLQQYAKAKLDEHTAEKMAELFGGAVSNKFGGGKPVQVGKFMAKGPTTQTANHLAKSQTEAAINQEFADAVKNDLVGGGARATIDPETLKNLMLQAPEVADELAANEPLMRELMNNLKLAQATKKSLGAQAKSIFEAGHNRLQAKDKNAKFSFSVDVDGKRVQVEYQQPQRQNLFFEKEWNKHFAQAEKAAGQALPEEQKLAMREEFYRQKAAEYGDNPEEWQAIAEKAAANLAAKEEALKKAEKVMAPKGQWTYQKYIAGGLAAARKITAAFTSPVGASLTGASLLSSGQQAQAYNFDGDPGKTAGPLAGLSAGVGIGLMILGGARKLKPGQLKSLIDNGGAAASAFLGDTLDHVQEVDKLMGTKMAARIQWHNMQTILSQWGVKFDSQAVKARAMNELRQGLDTNEALAGKAGTEFEHLDAKQRRAVVTYHLQRKTLAKEINTFVGKFKALKFLSENPGADLNKALAGEIPSFASLPIQERAGVIQQFQQNGPVKFGKLQTAHIAALGDSLGGGSGASDWMSSMVGNSMEALFGFNPQFQLLNLTDSLIAGGSRIGPFKMAKSWKLMATDKEIQKLFENNNIFGSYKADIQAGSAANPLNKYIPDKLKNLSDYDISADPVNATRTALASFLQSHQKALGAGLNVGEKDFLKAVLQNAPTGQITQQVIDDAWLDMADHGLRTLAIDPFRVNKNALSLVPGVKYFAPFINQPARIARLANEYWQQGDYKKLGTMVGIITALGGKASIPVSVRLAWENIDPNSAFATESALDDISIPGLAGAAFRATNPGPDAEIISAMLQRDMSGKLDWDPLLFSFVGKGAPAGQALANLATELPQAPGALTDSEAKRDKYLQARASDLSMLGALGPTGGAAMRLMRAGKASAEGEKKIWQFENNKIVGKDSLKLKELPGGDFYPFLDLIAPGSSVLEGSKKSVLNEKAKRKESVTHSAKEDEIINQDFLKYIKSKYGQ